VRQSTSSLLATTTLHLSSKHSNKYKAAVEKHDWVCNQEVLRREMQGGIKYSTAIATMHMTYYTSKTQVRVTDDVHDIDVTLLRHK
jgi:hypothetical protein